MARQKSLNDFLIGATILTDTQSRQVIGGVSNTDRVSVETIVDEDYMRGVDPTGTEPTHSEVDGDDVFFELFGVEEVDPGDHQGGV